MMIKRISSQSTRPPAFGEEETKHEMNKTAFALLFFFLTGLSGLTGQSKDSEDLGGLRSGWPGSGQTGQRVDRGAAVQPHASQPHPGSESASWGILGPAMGIQGGAS